jgi:hypothetical protein
MLLSLVLSQSHSRQLDYNVRKLECVYVSLQACVYLYMKKIIYIEYCLYANLEQYSIESYKFVLHTENFVLKEQFLYFSGKVA